MDKFDKKSLIQTDNQHGTNIHYHAKIPNLFYLN